MSHIFYPCRILYGIYENVVHFSERPGPGQFPTEGQPKPPLGVYPQSPDSTGGKHENYSFALLYVVVRIAKMKKRGSMQGKMKMKKH
jgi:hypothetical protein